MKKIKQTRQAIAICLIIAAMLSGCNSESRSAVDKPEPVQPQPTQPEPPQEQYGSVNPVYIGDIIEPIPATPIVPSEPVKPPMPIFVPEGINTITQQPYSGAVIRGGDAYLRYDSGASDFQDFELPSWTVKYKYSPFLEVLITNGAETLCTRYSWKKGGFGYAKSVCNWSDTREALPLKDMKQAYYDYSIVETRVWVSGVDGERVGIEK